MPPALFRATCNIKVKLFPFDKQQCRLIFRSTDYDATLMDFRTRLLRVKFKFGDSLSVSLERKACAIEQSYIEVSNVSSEWVILNTQE